jgi:hypothetical protein
MSSATRSSCWQEADPTDPATLIRRRLDAGDISERRRRSGEDPRKCPD